MQIFRNLQTTVQLQSLQKKYEISDMVTLKASDDASKDDAKDDTEAADDTEADTAEEK